MERRSIAVTGIVQGVGFRPFVYDLAIRLCLNGFVRNQTGGVLIELEGKSRQLNSFLAELTGHPPPLAKIDRVNWLSARPRGEAVFRIEASELETAGPIFIATCDDCLRELFDPRDRRYRYPFLNCANCVPRLTIIRGAPYDRERTTMSAFAMSPACRSELECRGSARRSSAVVEIVEQACVGRPAISPWSRATARS